MMDGESQPMSDTMHLVKKCHSTIPSCSEMELDENESLKSSNGTIVPQTPEKGEGSNVVFTKETSLLTNDNIVPRGYGCGCGCSAKLGSRDLYTAEESDARKKEKEKDKQERKLCKQDRVELGRMFQKAMSSQNWDRAESLVMGADLQTLNDALCLALDSIWFLTARLELEWVTWMIQKIVSCGANDFTRAALRTSFLASCVSACQNKVTSLVDTVSIMDQKLNERLQECNGDEVLKAQAGAKVQKFTEWAMRCIGFHTRCHESRGKGNRSTVLEVQLQLGAFKAFLDLAGDNLTGKDFTEAFDAACFPLTLFSNSFEPGWSAGLSATSVKGLLEMLVEGGADNVNQCFLEASRFGSTELVRILLQIAHWNSLDVDVDLALGFASHYCKIGTMECLVEEGLAFAFLGPLMRAAERGCLEVVEWFVERGCHDMELCLAITAATSSSQLATIEYLLPHVPRHVISSLGAEIIKAAGDRSGGPASLDGVAFLLGSDFLGDASATYAAADSVAGSDDEAVAPDLRDFLREHWSASAFSEGMESGRDHYVNFMRVLKRGDSPVRLRDLPPPLVTAVAYLPLYRECVAAGTPLLSQRLRGRLVDAAQRLGDWMEAEYATQGTDELLALLMRYLPPFLH